MKDVNSQFGRSVVIARELAGLWKFSKLDLFRQYVESTYGVPIQANPQFRCVIVCEMRSADFERMSFNHPLVKRRWAMDEDGFREGSDPELIQDVEQGFFLMPTIRFCTKNEQLLVSERLGPRFLHKRLQQITPGDPPTIGETIRDYRV